MKNNIIALQRLIPTVTAPAILVIMLTTLSWNYNCTESLYFFIAASLFFAVKNIFPDKKVMLFSVAIFAPITTIIIKQKIARLKQDQKYMNEPVSLVGTLVEVRPSFDKNISTMCIILTDFMTQKNKRSYLKKRVHLFLPPRTRIKTQQKITLKSIKVKAPPLGSYGTFCLQNNIWGIAYATYKDYCLQHTPESKRVSIFESISRQLSLKTKILFELIFLGKKDKGYISQKIQHQSLYWGTSHIMARSGMHLSIIFLLIFCILAALPIPYQYKIATNLLLIICFFISTQYSTSFNRAFLMITAYLLSQIHKVLPNGPHLLSILTFFILLHNPFTALSLSFQLSFGITYIIIKALSANSNKKHCFNR